MKKADHNSRVSNIIYCGLIFTLMLFGCNKSDSFYDIEGIDKLENVNMVAISQVQLSTDLNKQRQYFYLLSPNEKYVIWKERFNDLIKGGKLNKKQFDLVQKISSQLSTDLFNTKSSVNQKFKNESAFEFTKEAISIFGVEEATIIFTTLFSNSKYLSNGQKEYATSGAENCNCKVGVNLCWLPSVPDGGCQQNGCIRQEEFCGFLLQQPCDGFC